MRRPKGEASTANITPDPSGISYYDEVLFIEVMRTGYVKARKLSSIMPFNAFKFSGAGEKQSTAASNLYPTKNEPSEAIEIVKAARRRYVPTTRTWGK